VFDFGENPDNELARLHQELKAGAYSHFKNDKTKCLQEIIWVMNN